jgi:hypothetical protein
MCGLRLVIHRQGQPGQHHQRNRMARQSLADALGRLLRAHLAHHQGVEPHYPIGRQHHVGAASSGPLVRQGETNQEAVKGFVATIKSLQGMAGPD